jgi:hypothetical protein
MIKTFTKTGDIKAQFDFCNELHTIAYAKVSKGSFEVEFRDIKQSKTYLQLKGIHKLCEIYGDYMTEALGRTISFENAKESLKYAIDYTRLANENEAIAEAFRLKREKELQGEKMKLKDFQNLVAILEAHYQVPASFADASLEDMQILIEKIHELGRDRGWHKLILTSQDMQSLINSYK